MVPKVIGLIWGLYMIKLRFRMKDFRFELNIMQNNLILS